MNCDLCGTKVKVVGHTTMSVRNSAQMEKLGGVR
jgi:hypothetical protein